MKEFSLASRPVDRIEPYLQQYDYSCAAASLLIAYSALGQPITEARLMYEVGITEEGADWDQVRSNVSQHGFEGWWHEYGSYSDMISVYRVTGYPVVVSWFTERGETPPDEHFSVIKRIDRNSITLADPGIGDFYTMDRREFEQRWKKHNDHKDHSTSYLVIAPKKP